MNDISDTHKLLGLDHLRALAIVTVFFFHYQFFGHPAWLPAVASFGWTGVDLFFVLSGFLIAGQLFNGLAKGKPIPMREFFLKRFFRIIPPYFLVIILYALFPYVREWGTMSPLWRYFTFTLNFGLDLKKYGTFSHAWSLCVEEQFYLVLPLCFALFGYIKAGRYTVYVLAALFIGGFILRIGVWNYQVVPQLPTNNLGPLWNQYVYYPTYNRLDGLLFGVSIAGIFTYYPDIKNRVNQYSNMLMLAGAAIIVAAYFVCNPRESFNTGVYGFPIISFGFGAIVMAIVCPSNVFYSIKSKVTEQLAALSYSIYLIHKIVIHVMQDLLGKIGLDKNGVLMMVCCMITTVCGALLMRYIVEMPSLRLRNRILDRWKLRGKLHLNPVE